MTATATLERTESLVSALGLDDSFQPQEPATLKDTGLSEALVEDLILKFLSGIGSESGRAIADNLCLPMAILEDRFVAMRQRQEIAPTGVGDARRPCLSPDRRRARPGTAGAARVCLRRPGAGAARRLHQLGPRPNDFVRAAAKAAARKGVLRYSRRAGDAQPAWARRSMPARACSSTVRRATARRRSPNGSRAASARTFSFRTRSSKAARSSRCIDASCHQAVRSAAESLFRTAEFDRRWIRIERPTVVVGGELTMDSLELKHDPVSNVSEASLQLKSNCGCLLIDDFGRQRINPTELLNRWIIPLENRIDYLSLSNGRKIEVPFEQLIIFSTNLEPHDLADDAFLRRIPFKVEIGDPSSQEFHLLFQMFAKKHPGRMPAGNGGLPDPHALPTAARPLRRCHARDLLEQVIYYCNYNELPLEITEEYLDHAVRNYFTALKGD